MGRPDQSRRCVHGLRKIGAEQSRLEVDKHEACRCDRARRIGFAAAARAQTYPSHPITFVVALPAGGAVDALARVLAEHMRGTLGQPIVVENMGGAGGTLSITRVVRAAPDGYTVGMGTLGQYVVSGAVYTLPFDMLADFTPVARCCRAFRLGWWRERACLPTRSRNW